MPISLVGQLSYSLLKKIGGPKLFGVQEGKLTMRNQSVEIFQSFYCFRYQMYTTFGQELNW